MRRFPEPALREEEGLVRSLVMRGASPTEMTRVYRAALGTLSLNGGALHMDPVLCLVRVLSRVIAQYQMEQSIAAAKRVD
jgi:hypothetical protein